MRVTPSGEIGAREMWNILRPDLRAVNRGSHFEAVG
jgi:hypothetical protein